ncbi:hypothetical protein V511_06315 [Mesotoga sp. Brook.08.YT.4.2.5.1]|nr:hypothetical protein V511_06315 [Mesotoga sp. Brook.08.YT.4.2.5.1]RAM59084.1 hypothetical protein DS65_01780 [Mesotoga sp. SC_4PWL113PWK15]
MSLSLFYPCNLHLVTCNRFLPGGGLLTVKGSWASKRSASSIKRPAAILEAKPLTTISHGAQCAAEKGLYSFLFELHELSQINPKTRNPITKPTISPRINPLVNLSGFLPGVGDSPL